MSNLNCEIHGENECTPNPDCTMYEPCCYERAKRAFVELHETTVKLQGQALQMSGVIDTLEREANDRRRELQLCRENAAIYRASAGAFKDALLILCNSAGPPMVGATGRGDK